jgi:hypothetical protein
MKMLLLKPDSTNRNYLNAITIFLQHENRDTYRDLQEWQEYSQARDDLNDKMAKAIQLNLRTDRQKKNWITPEEYQHVLDQIESTLRQSRDQARKYQEYVLLRLYEKVPSRNDFATVCVTTKRQYNENHHDDKNYLVLERDNYHFMLHDWKTKTAELDQCQILLSTRLQGGTDQEESKKSTNSQPDRLLYHIGGWIRRQSCRILEENKTEIKKKLKVDWGSHLGKKETSYHMTEIRS